MTQSAAPQKYHGGIILDAEDLRDLFYRPSLGLLPKRFLCAALDLPPVPVDSLYPSGLSVRDQGKEPSCIGQALAAVVDIQRIESLRHTVAAADQEPKFAPVSAAMLHAVALEAENLTRDIPTNDIYSLRSGLKGFYNTGVCSQDMWEESARKKDSTQFDAATVPVMREARNITMGAYYRVQSFINDYHAALVEAGALYVSAEMHRGWRDPELRQGVIDQRVTEGLRFSGGHAFVVVGYNHQGFLVLSSWGPKWGGYEWNGRVLPGVALWPYDDWAAHVLDCWVLRLAAPTPDSFRHAIGGHWGAASYGAHISLALSTVRRMEVLGHYLHLQDGAYVKAGAYPSSRISLDETLRHLEDQKDLDFDHIRLTFHGDTAPVEALMARLARNITEDKRQRVHGFSMIWTNGLLSGAAEALEPLFNAAQVLAKGKREDADRRIEQMTRPVGRAIWRDVKRSASIAGQPPPPDEQPGGDAALALSRIIDLCRSKGKHLHLVSEGAGSLLLAKLMETVQKKQTDLAALIEVLASVTLVAPLNTEEEFDDCFGPVLEAWQAKSDRKATILLPNRAFDERLAVGAYSRSWTELVARAFEDHVAPAEPPKGKGSGSSSADGSQQEQAHPTLIGDPDFQRRLRSKRRERDNLRGEPNWITVPPPKGKSGRLTSDDLLQHEAVAAYLVEIIGPAPDNQNPATKGG